jgi:hypothetical protein
VKTCIECKQEFPKTLEYFYKQTNGLQSYCKECVKARSKAWHKANPEKANTSTRSYYAANSEKVKEIKKAYYLANSEKQKARSKAYYLKNSEKVKARKNAWYIANLEKQNAAARTRYKANPDKAIANGRIRRAKRLGNGHEPYTHKEIFETYGTNCYLCDMPINLQISGRPGSNPQWRSGLHIEHFIDIALGGSDTIENVRPSHAWCNLTKGSN